MDLNLEPQALCYSRSLSPFWEWAFLLEHNYFCQLNRIPEFPGEIKIEFEVDR